MFAGSHMQVTPYDLSLSLGYNRLFNSHRAFTLAISTHFEPKTYRQVVPHKHWQQAMISEFNALEENNTWTLTTLPPEKLPIGCKWIYKVKYRSVVQ